jgi:hypothetical protein
MVITAVNVFGKLSFASAFTVAAVPKVTATVSSLGRRENLVKNLKRVARKETTSGIVDFPKNHVGARLHSHKPEQNWES